MALKLSTRSKIAIATLLNRVVLASLAMRGRPPAGVYTRNGIRYHLDLHEGIDFAVYLFGLYERDLTRVIERLLDPGDVAVDAGANVGIHTMKMAQLVGSEGKVLAFEPTTYAFGKLLDNLAFNPPLQSVVQPHHAFLVSSPDVDAPGEVYSSWPLSRGGGDHESHGGALKATGEASATTLDSVFEDEVLSDPKLIKLDVDGFELEVLRGAERVVARARPHIVIELCHEVAEEHDHTVADLLEFLLSRDYEFVSLRGEILGSDCERILALIPRGGGINVLARPKDLRGVS